MIFSAVPPRILTSSSLTALTTCWPGVRLRESSAPTSSLAQARDDVPDYQQVDVRLEQRHADLPQRLVDVLLVQPAPAAQARENAFEPVGKRLEHLAGHATARLGRAAARPSHPCGPGARRQRGLARTARLA